MTSKSHATLQIYGLLVGSAMITAINLTRQMKDNINYFCFM